MKPIQIISIISGAIISNLLSFNVMAHALWLEGNDTEVKLYFGEYAENRRETSGGYLDSIVDPAITLIDMNGKEKQIEVMRKDNHFAISRANATNTTVLVQSLKQPVREPRGEIPSPVYKRYLYARLGKSGGLPLDIQNNGDLLRLTFMGRPVPDVEVIIIAPNGWEKHLRTNTEGEVVFPQLESGLYVVEAKFELNKPGEFEGKAYTVESHKTTLTLYK